MKTGEAGGRGREARKKCAMTRRGCKGGPGTQEQGGAGRRDGGSGCCGASSSKGSRCRAGLAGVWVWGVLGAGRAWPLGPLLSTLLLRWASRS